ncbi:hypothetical protein AHAT_22340 [Agarivorans sp. Toyoura001]|uniref:hypothetical protein n=1 Tax=Agarivorans sp. Toyoura001 TaxID=2283141 RepID=UPI0010D3B880|nr:hypothetical protein [Agarivorans sp. Toyoura001]GDY26344.1 hypothetical protein AHAT_22340 [Agarivorans sp. Toyoura001]
MNGFWKGLFIIILVMLTVRCDTNSSLYKAEENGIRLEAPRFLVTPFIWVDKQVGEPIVWGYNSPFSDDYEFKYAKAREDDAPPAE